MCETTFIGSQKCKFAKLVKISLKIAIYFNFVPEVMFVFVA